ncbi:hypothetical protein T07_14304, partial [Trichinella nelsoni]
LATLVHMGIKAFPSRPSVPLLITNSIVHHCGLRHPMKLVPFATRLRIAVPKCFVFNVLVRNCEDESRILNDLHRI